MRSYSACYRGSDGGALQRSGFALFIEYVFACWDLRKLYMELPEFNLPQFASGVGRTFVQEARFDEHVYYGGRYWAQVVLALYRDRWRTDGRRIVEAALPARSRTARVTLDVDSRN